MMHRWGIIFVLLGAVVFLCSCENKPVPAQKHKRIEFFIYEGTMECNRDGTPVILNQEDSTNMRVPVDITYIYIDTGLIVYRTKSLSDTSWLPDTTFYFSDNYKRDRVFKLNDQLIYHDSDHWDVGDLTNMCLIESDSGTVMKRKSIPPPYIMNLVNSMVRHAYGNEMDGAKEGVLARTKQITHVMWQYTFFPTLVFCPVIKKDGKESL